MVQIHLVSLLNLFTLSQLDERAEFISICILIVAPIMIGAVMSQPIRLQHSSAIKDLSQPLMSHPDTTLSRTHTQVY